MWGPLLGDATVFGTIMAIVTFFNDRSIKRFMKSELESTKELIKSENEAARALLKKISTQTKKISAQNETFSV